MRRSIAKSSDGRQDRSSSPPPRPSSISSSNAALSSYVKPTMKVAVLLAILIWVKFNFGPTSTGIAKPKAPPRPSPETIPFDIGGATKDSYSTFMTTLRGKLKDPKASYFGIPMLPKAYNPPKYIYVELKSTRGNSITLGIDMSNVYVVGYSDRYQGKARARFFNDAPTDAKDTLFPDAKGTLRTRNIGYTGQYNAIQDKAQGDRKRIGLGIKKLDSCIDKLFGKDTKDKNFVKTEAEFFLVAIQTVSEAARSKYIEGQIKDNFDKDYFSPNPKVISFEDEWGKVSEAIRRADPKTGEIPKKYSDHIELYDAEGNKWPVTNVNQIKEDMGLLKYVV